MTQCLFTIQPLGTVRQADDNGAIGAYSCTLVGPDLRKFVFCLVLPTPCF